MQIHWEHKWLAIPYNGSWTVLQGLDAVSPDSVYLQLFSAEDLESASVSPEPLPPQIQHLVDSFATLFEPPTTLPPSRSCNHSTPLVPGAQPVFVRPYCYPPNLKDEIEQQVKEMLDQGIIQPSSSAFASPVLLVKKKDGSYRFCLDFRQLNALTAKSKFPVLVFDHLWMNWLTLVGSPSLTFAPVFTKS